MFATCVERRIHRAFDALIGGHHRGMGAHHRFVSGEQSFGGLLQAYERFAEIVIHHFCPWIRRITPLISFMMRTSAGSISEQSSPIRQLATARNASDRDQPVASPGAGIQRPSSLISIRYVSTTLISISFALMLCQCLSIVKSSGRLNSHPLQNATGSVIRRVGNGAPRG